MLNEQAETGKFIGEEIESMDVDMDMPVFDVDEAVEFIAARSNVEKDVIELVLELEEDYMREIGIIVDLPDEQ